MGHIVYLSNNTQSIGVVFLEFDKRDIMMFIHPWIYYHFSTVLDVVQPWSTTGCCRYALCLNNMCSMCMIW